MSIFGIRIKGATELVGCMCDMLTEKYCALYKSLDFKYEIEYSLIRFLPQHFPTWTF
jgi:hypothetical protein